MFRGFFHLGLLIFFISHCRLIIDNLTKYGILFKLPFLFNDNKDLSPSPMNWDPPQILLSIIGWIISAFLSYLIEKIAAHPKFSNWLSDTFIIICNTILGICNILIPCVWVWRSRVHPILCMIYLFQSVILWLKLISYVHVNRDIRLALKIMKQNEKSLLQDDNNAKPIQENICVEIRNLEPPFINYPQNLTISNLFYFCMIPTLCYQLNYPRSEKIRWKYIITIFIRLIIVAILIVFFVEQYILPNLQQSLQPMIEGNKWQLFNRLLRLCVPNTYVWLLSFYWFFHLWMNLLAEFTRFGDRLFYKVMQI